ncbi:MAG: hypothetical protein ACK587_06870 [Cyanobacteriota bacterium]
MTVRPRPNWMMPGGRRMESGEQGFVLPLVIPVALLLIMGATTLMSRTATGFLVAAKQTDAQLAREAAESGMSRVLGALNPYGKFSTDPYVSFLLASRWEENSGVTYNTGVTGSPVVRSGWRLTGESQSSVRALLRQCGLSDRGHHANQLPPDSAAIYQNMLSGTIGATGRLSGTQLRFMVTNYVPPARQDSTVSWPTECADFSGLSGGSAQITVEGRVIRNGALVSRYTLTRTLDVQGWPMLSLPVSWLTINGAGFPGPPVGLRIGGTATNLNQLQTGYFTNFLESEGYSDMYGSGSQLPMCAGLCPNGRPWNNNANSYTGLEMRVSAQNIIPANDSDLPRYPFNTSVPPSGIVPLQINESRANYPYMSAGNTSINNLYPECRHSQTLNLNNSRESRQSEIDCWIDSVGVPKEVSSVSYDKPTNLFTITLAAGARYDVQVGTRLKVDVQTGSLNNGATPWRGTVTSSGGSPQVITFTPDNPQPSDTVSPYSTPSSPSPNAAFVSPDNGSTPLSLIVNTEARPVNLIITGNVGSPTPANYVVLKHLVRESPAQRYVHSITGVNVRSAWTRLRIFGLSRNGGSCPATPDQTFYINPEPLAGSNGEESSLAGAFLWLPRGALVYGTGGQTYPQQLLTVWWLCHLDISGLPANRPTRLTFITPLNGNPEAMEAVLPGGFRNASGEFIPDLRFPVYPSLPRIRSTF